MWSIYKKELKVYFTSLVGYIVMFLYLGLSVFFFFGFFMYNPESTSDFTGFFGMMDSLYLFIIPILTLRILAEDKKIGTIELLLTSPISTWSIILGKFLGVLTFVLTGASLMILYPVFLSFFVRSTGERSFPVISG
jgi:ABC-2 type transport system permease protein